MPPHSVTMGHMTEREETDVPVQEIDFMGRDMRVRMPSPEQLLVWKRTIRQLQGADTGKWTAVEAMSALERSRKIIDSVLEDPADVDWLDDGMLEGTILLTDTSQIIQKAVEAFAEAAEAEGNRETRRAAEKAKPKKAARKKPAAKPAL
jgi:hypothetical protein